MILKEMSNTSQPFFTIGVLTYNRRDMLAECLQSILAQTFIDYEVIIGNDYVADKLQLEEFDIEDDKPQKGNMIADDKIEESPDDSKFNTEKHHKRQHKF